ncbi:MAG: M14 family metallopeptidase [Bdellovibrionota bacterium]
MSYVLGATEKSSYHQDREELLKCIWGLKGTRVEHRVFNVPSQKYKNLFLDTLYFPPLKTPQKLFMLSSGVHGVEAPLGSQIQRQFLSNTFSDLDRDHLGVLIVHVLNPYGYVEGIRVTESNVDLNRNFFSHEKFPHLESNAFEKYRSVLSVEKSLSSRWRDGFSLLSDVLRVSVLGGSRREEFTQAFAGGQYSDPKGVYFGGQDFEPQVMWFSKILDEILPLYQELLLYDVHTGLGKEDQLQLISSLESQRDRDFLTSFKQKVEVVDKLSVVSPESDGFYVTRGDFIDFVHAKASRQARVLAFTAEFGTLGDSIISKLQTLSRIVFENRGRNFGYANSELERSVQASFVELFNPTSSEWNLRAMNLANYAIKAALLEFRESQVLKKASIY